MLLIKTQKKEIKPTPIKQNIFSNKILHQTETTLISKEVNLEEVAVKIDDLKFVESDKLRTIVLIPFEKAPKDPSWLTKKHARKRLNIWETEEYFKNEY